MTGFGRGEASDGQITAVAELSTVNRKQFDCHLSLPKELSALESRIETLLHQFIRRGQIKGTVTIAFAKSTGGLTVNLDLAQAQVAAIREAAQKLGLRDDLAARDLFQLPDVLVFNAPEADSEVLWPVVSKAVEAAARQLVAMRVREGKTLAKDVAARLAHLRKLRTELVKRAKLSPIEYRDKLAERLKKLAGGVQADPEILARELVLFADRTDVTEELTRLGSHLEQATRIMKGDEPCGRQLDFLCQELLREINTTGSKCSDAEIAKTVVEFKSVLETIREQVQNFE
jgi:uncharacterized protein (TIGR00255 family)